MTSQTSRMRLGQLGLTIFGISAITQIIWRSNKVRNGHCPKEAISISMHTLIPSLIFVLLVSVDRDKRNRQFWLTLGALCASALGDILPQYVSRHHRLKLKGSLFLVTQCLYIAAFFPGKKNLFSLPAPWLPLINIAHIAFISVIAGRGNRFASTPKALVVLLTALYAIFLNIMQILALSSNRLTAAGASTFLAADLMLLMRDLSKNLNFKYLTVAEISCYMVAQALLTAGASESCNGINPVPSLKPAISSTHL